MSLKIDFHVHTYYSQDSVITLKEAISYAKNKGLDGIAITDHNTLKGVLRLRVKNFVVIPGIEVSTLNGHLLGINVTRSIPAKMGIKETIRRIHDVGGIAVAPHPSVFYKSPPSRKVKSYDAVEVMNAASIPFSVFTYLSKKFAEDLGVSQLGGSDSHYAPEIGSAYTIVKSDPDVDEIINAVKNGYTIPVGRAIPWRIRLGRAALGLKRRV